MLLAKESGGTTIHHDGKRYAWKADGAVTEVPDDLGRSLLAIHGGGYSEAAAPAPPAAKAPPKSDPPPEPAKAAPAAKA